MCRSWSPKRLRPVRPFRRGTGFRQFGDETPGLWDHKGSSDRRRFIERFIVVSDSHVSLRECGVWSVAVELLGWLGCSVWLNSYMEATTRSLMREINRNLQQTAMKDANQLRVFV